jgi:hypothetical protein
MLINPHGSEVFTLAPERVRVVEIVPAAVVEIVPVRVVEIVPAAVVEMVPTLVVDMVPALVVEMVPALVVEMVPVLASAAVETVTVRRPANKANVNFLMMFSWSRKVRGLGRLN